MFLNAKKKKNLRAGESDKVLIETNGFSHISTVLFPWFPQNLSILPSVSAIADLDSTGDNLHIKETGNLTVSTTRHRSSLDVVLVGSVAHRIGLSAVLEVVGENVTPAVLNV